MQAVPEEFSDRNLAAEAETSFIHVGIICDVCNQTIVGSRHKCLNCRGELAFLRRNTRGLVLTLDYL